MKKFALTLLLTVLLVCSLIMLVLMARELYQTRNQLEYLETRQTDYQERVERIEKDLMGKEEYLEKLLTDNVFLERVVRERLGYVNPEETIFRFPKDENEPADPPTKP